jgi:hypothetical protein
MNRHQFGPVSIRVGCFLLERRKAGDDSVDIFESVHERFPNLSFRDFFGGFVFAEAAEVGALISLQEEGHA